MEDLPEPLLAEIVKRITKTSDLNSLSLVSKQLCTVEAEHRDAIRVGCGLNPSTEALVSLFSRFPNLAKVEINYSGWWPSNGNQLNNQGLCVLSSHCPSLSDLSLSFCSYIGDSGLGYLADCKKLRSLRLNCAPAVTSTGIFRVAVGCRHLSVLHLVDCMAVDSREWLEYLGRYGSLVELVVKDCDGISQYDLLKFGPGWENLQKFVFEINGNYWMSGASDPSYVSGYPYRYDICCDSLKDLRLAHIITEPETGLRFLLGKCKALETLYLEYVIGLKENETIALFQRCSNLKTISLRFMPLRCEDYEFRTPLTDVSLKALALSCPMLQVVELTFTFCEPMYPTEIGFTQEGIVSLVQSCPVRTLLLNGASILYDEGLKCLSSSQFLEKLELVDCRSITDAGMSFIILAPCFSNLTLRKCKKVTDNGMAELARSQKLESLTVIGCCQISQEGVQGAAKSVHYSAETESHGSLKGMNTDRDMNRKRRRSP
ncbi:F-box/LRR-repeat protein 14 [Aegilops tauschii subsp. strangulata]|uniref:F-box/LRR-repeat protein 15-like leucin rich repeat domain-containing protein n=1 Tax=Aegilops tauschii subsp. strangulata TaxID=200361 RepID=A0A453PXH7_AEGTS|nr:F-box/LRR-repeat protein 14 [Aegilops tauschii subsp. strangulata]